MVRCFTCLAGARHESHVAGCHELRVPRPPPFPSIQQFGILYCYLFVLNQLLGILWDITIRDTNIQRCLMMFETQFFQWISSNRSMHIRIQRSSAAGRSRGIFGWFDGTKQSDDCSFVCSPMSRIGSGYRSKLNEEKNRVG